MEIKSRVTPPDSDPDYGLIIRRGKTVFLQCAMTGSALSADLEKKAWLRRKVRRTALNP